MKSLVPALLVAFSLGLPASLSACGGPEVPLPPAGEPVVGESVLLLGNLTILRPRCPDAEPWFELNADGQVYRLLLKSEELRKAALGLDGASVLVTGRTVGDGKAIRVDSLSEFARLGGLVECGVPPGVR